MRCSASLFVSIFGLTLMHTVMFTVLGFLLFFFLPFFFGLLPRWVCLGCVAQIAFGRKDVFFFMRQCGNCFVWDVGFLLLSQICMATVVDNHVG